MLRMGDRTIGVLHFASRQPGEFTVEHERIVLALADLVAAALSNAASSSCAGGARAPRVRRPPADARSHGSGRRGTPDRSVRVRVPGGQVPGGVHLSDAAARLPAHRCELTAEKPAAPSIRCDRTDLAHDCRERVLRYARVRVNRNPAPGTRACPCERTDDPPRVRTRLRSSICDGEPLGFDVGDRLLRAIDDGRGGAVDHEHGQRCLSAPPAEESRNADEPAVECALAPV